MPQKSLLIHEKRYFMLSQNIIGNNTSNISPQRIRKTVSNENGIKILEINIEYPLLSDINVKKEFTAEFNEFYQKIAENYSKYCEKKVLNNLRKSKISNSDFKAYGEIMKFYIPYIDKNYISVICDITHFDGYFQKRIRTSQTWSCEKNIILPCEFFLSKASKSVKEVQQEVGNIILEHLKNNTTEKSEFSFTSKSVGKYAFKANVNNYFLSPKGLGFWFECGTLAPESEGFPTFFINY